MPNLVSDELLEEIYETIAYVKRLARSPENPRRILYPQMRSMNYAIANEEIAEATNAVNNPTTGDVEILSKDSSGDYERSGRVVTVTNRWEHIPISKDTLVIISRIRGEWAVTGSDCSEMGNPPA